MYLHLGENIIVNTKDIIGIFDLDTSTIKKVTRDYLKKAQNDNIVINISQNLPKSFIVCNINNKNIIYISQISSVTLCGRLKTSYFKEVT